MHLFVSKCGFIAVLLVATAACYSAVPGPLDGTDFFETKIRPLLVDRCFECHSTTSKKIKGGLTLDARDSVLKGGDSGPVIVPGHPEKSLLIKAVQYSDKDLQMPPNHRLAPGEI